MGIVGDALYNFQTLSSWIICQPSRFRSSETAVPYTTVCWHRTRAAIVYFAYLGGTPDRAPGPVAAALRPVSLIGAGVRAGTRDGGAVDPSVLSLNRFSCLAHA